MKISVFFCLVALTLASLSYADLSCEPSNSSPTAHAQWSQEFQKEFRNKLRSVQGGFLKYPVLEFPGDLAKARRIAEIPNPLYPTFGVTFQHVPEQRYSEKIKTVKKIEWIQRQELSDDEWKEICEKTAQGFGVIGFDPRDSVRVYRRGSEFFSEGVLIFHPQFEKSAHYLFELIQGNEGKNQYEIGLLLGYSEVDVHAWVFGTDSAAKAYPKVIWAHQNNSGYPPEQKDEWRKLGQNRLRVLLPDDELRFIVPSLKPRDVSMVGSQPFQGKVWGYEKDAPYLAIFRESNGLFEQIEVVKTQPHNDEEYYFSFPNSTPLFLHHAFDTLDEMRRDLPDYSIQSVAIENDRRKYIVGHRVQNRATPTK